MRIHFRASFPYKRYGGAEVQTKDLLMCIFAWLKTITTRAAVLLLVPLCADSVLAQSAPATSNHPWIGPWEQQIKRDAGQLRDAVADLKRTTRKTEKFERTQALDQKSFPA